MAFAIENVMEMTTPTGTTLSFRYVGNPPAQRRARFTFRRSPFRFNGLAATSRQWFYDPDARNKAIFRNALTAAMADLDIAPLPFLGVRTGLQIHCEFVLPRPRIDFDQHGLVYLLRGMCSCYPDKKDTNNMLKYFMDALAGVVYANDNCIVNVRASKAYPDDNQYGTTGWAEICVSSIK